MSKLDTLEPVFRDKIIELLKQTEEATGRKWGISAGRRTMKEQKAIYAQGRTAPGKIVSNAPPGSSAHNYGLAADLWPLTKDGKDFDWVAGKVVFKVMADLAVKLGLTAGFYFKTFYDAPHIEDPSWRKQRELWKSGKITVE